MGDRGMIVSAVSWILLVAMIFTLLARLGMKYAMLKRGHKFGLDDVFIVLAALFSVGQTAAVSMEAMHVLGQHYSSLSVDQLRIFQKSEYAGCLLYIANMGCARISVCLLVKKILPGSCVKMAVFAFAIFSALWMVSGVLVTAFACNFPEPWNFFGNKCIHIVRFINYVWATNIVVEVIIIIIPLVVWNIRLSAARSVSVSFVFLSRLSVIAAVIAQLIFFNRTAYSPDPTYSHWATVLCAQIAQNLSIITACAPCLHPFILSILSGETKTETLRLDCAAKRFRKYWYGDPFDPTASHSSTLPLRGEKQEDYCRPLATYGLDRSSAHLNSQHFNRFPSNIALPIASSEPPENVFMRHVEIPPMRSWPPSRPPTRSSSQKTNVTRSPSQKTLPPIPPKSLAQVGVLPVVDWDTDSSDKGSQRSGGSAESAQSRGSAGSRRAKRNSDYIFQREKVISVPEANAMNEQEYWKRYPPPPKSGEK